MSELAQIALFLAAGLCAGVIATRWYDRRNAELSKPARESAMLRHLQDVGLPDTPKTVNQLKAALKRGLEASKYSAEAESLRARLHEMEAERANLSDAAPNPSEQLWWDYVRDSSLQLIEAQLGDAIVESPGVEDILELTNFMEAREQVSAFKDVADLDAVRLGAQSDWFHSLLRTEALLRTYCSIETTAMVIGLSYLNAALRHIAADHDIIVHPIRLLIPGEAGEENDEQPYSALSRIRPVRQTLEKLAQAMPRPAPIGLVIDCRRCRVDDATGTVLSAKTTWFDPLDWRKPDQ